MFSLLFAATFSYAQSEAETLEWLNIKKADIALHSCSSNTVGMYTASKLLITSTSLRLENNSGAWTEGNWNSVKEVKPEGTYDIKIVYNFTYNDKPTVIGLYTYDRVLREKYIEKYIKALKHMATLKGAKLIDSDLF